MFIFDFPGHTGESRRLTFAGARTILAAHSHEQVAEVLAQVEREAAQGRFAAGFVAYDAAPAFDAAMEIPGRDERLPLAYFGVFDEAVESTAPERVAADDVPTEWTATDSRASFDAAVASIRESIAGGDVYQVNHTLRMRSRFDGDPLRLYERLRVAQRARYSAYLDLGEITIASVSPELFFTHTGDEIETRPMKGTMRRGRWPGEDRAAATALAESAKDRAENVMIVDLLRNDVGRIAVTGTVDVPRLFDVERYPTVWQMTSTVRARVREDVSLADIFAALFPCGSVTGAPKIAATRQIASLESSPRGIYCGAIGMVRPGGDCVFNVAIRTVAIDRASSVAEYGTGSGITFDSTAEGEFDELLAKTAVLTAAAPDFQLIETLRVENGIAVRGEAHLQRMTESAEYFGFADVACAARGALGDALAAHPAGVFRVRLIADRGGNATVDVQPLDPNAVNPMRSIRVAIASERVRSDDVLAFHKTTHREIHDRARSSAAAAGADDALLINERGEVTELTIGNLVAELDGVRATPPRECGLLAGIFRQELLDRNEIVEQRITPRNLARATRLWRVNSLREWVPIELLSS